MNRNEMVRTQIEFRGIKNQAVLAAMRQVDRSRLVLPEWIDCAYGDTPLPIGEKQTISQPYIVALMTELLDPQPGDRILEIGTGSGYQAAILSQIVKDVYTVEIIPSLSERARKKLEELGYKNIQFRVGDGGYGWPDEAPFDGIIVTAAARLIPESLLEQLKPEGRMVIPVGDEYAVQTLAVATKSERGIDIKPTIGVRFVPMTGDSQRL